MAEKAQEMRPVLAAIAKIMGKVGAVEKRGKNDFHKYDYATAADIAHALQKHMADEGLIIIPYQQEMRLIANESAMAIDFAFEVTHVSGDRLEDRPVFTGMAAARNSKGGFDDKCANKCFTAAEKYFTLHLFRIPTGDYADPDADEAAAPAKPKPKPASNVAKAVPLPESPASITVPVSEDGQSSDWGAWGGAFKNALATAKSIAEVNAWCDANGTQLAGMMEQRPKWHAALVNDIEAARNRFRPQSADTPFDDALPSHMQPGTPDPEALTGKAA